MVAILMEWLLRVIQIIFCSIMPGYIRKTFVFIVNLLIDTVYTFS